MRKHHLGGFTRRPSISVYKYTVPDRASFIEQCGWSTEKAVNKANPLIVDAECALLSQTNKSNSSRWLFAISIKSS